MITSTLTESSPSHVRASAPSDPGVVDPVQARREVPALVQQLVKKSDCRPQWMRETPNVETDYLLNFHGRKSIDLGAYYSDDVRPGMQPISGPYSGAEKWMLANLAADLAAGNVEFVIAPHLTGVSPFRVRIPMPEETYLKP